MGTGSQMSRPACVTRIIALFMPVESREARPISGVALVMVFILPMAHVLRRPPAFVVPQPRIIRSRLCDGVHAADGHAGHAADEGGDHGGGTGHGHKKEEQAGKVADLVLPNHGEERKAEGEERGNEPDGKLRCTYHT